MSDNWKHRGRGMVCETCMFFAEKVKTEKSAEAAGVEKQLFGRCRRHTPTMSGYPAVFGTDWCGDHKLAEDKI